MKEIIEIRNAEELAEATALLLGMGYQRTSDSYWNQTFAKEGGVIILHIN